MSHPAPSFSDRANHRISLLTLAWGLGAGAILAASGQWKWAAGISAGAFMAWLNHRWLVQATGALVQLAAAQADAAKPRVPVSTWFFLAGRYFLIGLAAYAIVKFWAVPVSSILVGLLALGAATITEGLYEVFARPR
jgi:hypothetical protein